MQERIAGNIKAFRKLLNISQQILAEKAGISSSFLAAIETGSRNPSLETLEQIAAALEVRPESLFLESGSLTRSATPEQLRLIRSKLDGIISLLLDLQDIFIELDEDERESQASDSR